VQLLNRLVDLDEMLYRGDGIEYCLLRAFAGKVGILVLSRTSCSLFRPSGYMRIAIFQLQFLLLALPLDRYNTAVERSELLLRFREISGSNLCPETSYSD
jgi:hypothetical protein